MRLIDADAVKFKFPCGFNNNGILMVPYHSFKCSLDNAPTVDAVPVVRCRECKNWKPYGSKAARKVGDPLERYGGGEIWHGGHLETDFCSHGERMESSENHT
nr:MAG TPA: hypothetical protein [Caudoviricetes sp.]